MSLKVYNSLTNKKEEFKPIEDKKVGMYVCGVTVYDKCHIGHARGAFVFDVIRKYLEFKGYKVKYVRNITDVDDKIINKAKDLVEQAEENNQSKSLNEAVKEVTAKYIKEYYQDMEALGIEEADIEPKATEHIDDMIRLIKGLEDKGYAYKKDGDVYFEVKKFKDYGKLSNQSIENLRSGVRKKVNEKKKGPLDFALWKKAKEGEPSWKSPYSKGRPGWHIECSVMSMKYLGQTFDIHGGGRDLIFPHHENEIAQAESYTEKPFANYWIHNELLTIEGEKMSKSLGNFVSISKALEGYSPEDLKLFFLSSHYASPIDYNTDRLKEAESSRQRFYILFDKIERMEKEEAEEKSKSTSSHSKEIQSKLKSYVIQIEKQRKAFIDAMDDDFNTPGALASLFELVNVGNKFIADESVSLNKKSALLNSVKFTIVELGRILGLFHKRKKKQEEEEMELLDKVMNMVINMRENARKKKDFELADTIRDKLDEIGITLEDEKDKTIWRKK
jgi:cysteinyl-tRNA synthetase